LSKRDFIKFYEISLKSANESKYWLGLLRDATELDISDLLLELEEISRMLGASVITLKNKR
jgi:four helix bundle protein